MFNWDEHQVCLAEGPNESFVLLAIRPERLKNEGGSGEVIIWDDGDHQRAFILSRVIYDSEDLFRFEDDHKRQRSLRPLTAQLYAARVQKETGGPELPTDEKVRAFFLAPRKM